jgi:caffeoyl-CoA O-methyltransferase
MRAIIPKLIDDYATGHSSAPSALLRELAAYTQAHCENPQMLIGPLAGRLLQLLVRLGNVRSILEIGMFTGYSALHMAEALPDDGHIVCCELDGDRANIARGFFARSPHGHKIEIRIGRALDTLAGLRGPFDMVLIDADKESYITYYEAVLPMLASGGLVVADNVLWSGRVLRPESASDRAMAAFNQHVAADERVENVLLTVRDGITLARRR